MSTRSLFTALTLSLVAAAALPPALAQSPYPDLLYYKFDEGGGALTSNLAVPGVGSNPATVNGQTLSPVGGQFNGALVGVGGSGSTNHVDTGWITNLPGDFTIAFWLDVTATTANPFMYVLGDSTAGSFRCFTNGVAGTGGIVLKSGAMIGQIIPGGADQSAPHHVAWVYIASTRELRGYLDGVFVASTIQAVNTIAGTASFKVGTYSSTTPLLAGAVMDEFRLYGSALSDAEIAATWNISLSNNPGPVVFCTAGTTTNGCVPSISGSGTPSVSAPSGFTIDVSAVEGQKQGLVFYCVDNSGFSPSPWGQGTSLLCIKPPTQRMTNLSSGGTLGMCDGAMSTDWNAYRAANPSALGQPFAAGQQVFAQAWFRDPPSPKTTNLSDALQFTVGP